MYLGLWGTGGSRGRAPSKSFDGAGSEHCTVAWVSLAPFLSFSLTLAPPPRFGSGIGSNPGPLVPLPKRIQGRQGWGGWGQWEGGKRKGESGGWYGAALFNDPRLRTPKSGTEAVRGVGVSTADTQSREGLAHREGIILMVWRSLWIAQAWYLHCSGAKYDGL